MRERETEKRGMGEEVRGERERRGEGGEEKRERICVYLWKTALKES